MDTFHFRADVEFSILIVGCHHSAFGVRIEMIGKQEATHQRLKE